MRKAALPDLSELAQPGARVTVRVTPNASADAIIIGEPLQLRVTAPAIDGRANHAAQRLLARAMAIAPTRLRLVQGAGARQKIFEVAK